MLHNKQSIRSAAPFCAAREERKQKTSQRYLQFSDLGANMQKLKGSKSQIKTAQNVKRNAKFATLS